MRIYLVYSFGNATPEWWRVLGHRQVMVSADDVDGRVEEAIRLLQGLDVLVDSGGFRRVSRGRLPDPDTVLSVQLALYEAIGAIPVALDTPVPPEADEATVVAANRATFRLARRWQRVFGNSFILPLHALTPSQVVEAYREARRLLGSIEYIGLGSQAVLSRRNPCRVVENLKILRAVHEGRLHVFGVGNTTLLLVALSRLADSADTAAPLRDASYGLARHPETLSMVVVAPRKVNGRPVAPPQEVAKGCSCPVCTTRPSLLGEWGREGLIARAIHNAYQMLRMIRQGVALEVTGSRTVARVVNCLSRLGLQP